MRQKNIHSCIRLYMSMKYNSLCYKKSRVHSMMNLKTHLHDKHPELKLYKIQDSHKQNIKKL